MIKKIKKKLYNCFEILKNFWKTYVFVDELFIIRRRFKIDDVRFGLRINYKLDSNSVVFDVGGFLGEWSEKIFKKYGCNIYIFEPVPEFFNKIKEKFKNESRVHIFNFGLSDTNSMETISTMDDSSSIFTGRGDIEIKLRDIKEVIEELHIEQIDLLKLNIEGGEFKVLPRLIESVLINICMNIQVQFHHFYFNAEKLREEIRKGLSKTHELTYDYKFTFENWRKRGNI